MDSLILLVAAIVGFVIVAGVALVIVRTFYREVPAGKALLVRSAQGEDRLSRTGRLVLPFDASAELVDLTATCLSVDGGPRGFRCNDRIRVTLAVRFVVAVNPTGEDVSRAARLVGAPRVADEAALMKVFAGRFEEAIATTIADMSYDDVVSRRDQLKDRIMEIVGSDLEGFRLEDASVGEILQVPIEALDPSDLHDAEAIRRITEATSREALRTQEIRLETRMALTDRDVATAERIAQLEGEPREA